MGLAREGKAIPVGTAFVGSCVADEKGNKKYDRPCRMHMPHQAFISDPWSSCVWLGERNMTGLEANQTRKQLSLVIYYSEPRKTLYILEHSAQIPPRWVVYVHV